jgi:putative membrane protein
MLRNFSDHAANERTFLAWVRTGIAVIALGLVIERFDLFLLTAAKAFSEEGAGVMRLQRLADPFGRYGGLGLIFAGVVLIVISTLRFLQRERLLSTGETREYGFARAELALLVGLTLFLAAFSVYVAIG